MRRRAGNDLDTARIVQFSERVYKVPVIFIDKNMYNVNTKILHIVPKPDDSLLKMFIEVFHQSTTDELLNERFVREYTLALCKITLGSIRSKFQSLPGFNNAVSLDGETLRTEGATEKEALETDLIKEFKWSAPPFPLFRSTD